MWDELAETLPDNHKVEVVSADVSADMKALRDFHEFDMMGTFGVKEFLAGHGASSSSVQTSVDAKHLGPGSFRMLFDLYQAGSGPSKALASLSTWQRAYNQK